MGRNWMYRIAPDHMLVPNLYARQSARSPVHTLMMFHLSVCGPDTDTLMATFPYLKKCPLSPARTSGCTIDRSTALYFFFKYLFLSPAPSSTMHKLSIELPLSHPGTYCLMFTPEGPGPVIGCSYQSTHLLIYTELSPADS